MALFGDYAQSGYQSQFVARPTDLLALQSDQLQGKYDMAKLGTIKMRQLADSIQVMKEQKPLLEGELTKYEQAIGELAGRGDWENLGTEVEALAMDLDKNMKQGRLARLSSNFQNYQQYTKAKQELEKEGKYAEWNDDYRQYMKQNVDPTTGGFNFEQTGDISAYTFGGLGGAQDHQKRASEMMKDIAKDGYLNENVGFDEAGNIIGQKGGSEHVMKQKVQAIAESKADSFLNTQEGRDFAKMIQHNNGGRLDGTQLHEAAAAYLYNSATEQIFQKTTQGSDFKYAPKYIHDEKEFARQLADPTTATLEGQKNAQLAASTAIDELKLDKNGKVIVDEHTPAGGNQAAQAVGLTMGNPSLQQSGKTSRKKTQEELSKEVQKKQQMADNIIANYDRANPNNKLSPAEKIKAHQKARKNAERVIPSYIKLTPEAMTEQTRLAADKNDIAQMMGRKFVVTGGNLDGKQIGNVKDLMEQLDLEDGKFKIGVIGISQDDPYGMAGGEIISITANGVPYTVFTSPPTEQANDAYAAVRKVQKAVRSTNPKVVLKMNDYLEYVVENRATKDQNGNDVFESVVTKKAQDEDGKWRYEKNPVNGSKYYSLEEFKIQQQKAIRDKLSNYYNSDANKARSKDAIEADQYEADDDE